jgi:hypothetical protein
VATQYRQSGVVYRASGVAYGTPTTITPATIAATATIPTDFEFEYRQSGQAYRNSYDYRQALISGNAYLVVATPATIGVTTSITATGGIPITVSVSTIAAVAAVPAVDIDANYIHVDAGIAAICAVPAPTVITGALMTPATIAGVAALPAPTPEVVVIANHVGGTGAVPDPTREWHVLPGTITCTTTMGEEPVYTLLEMPYTMTLPPVGVPEEATRLAYGLRRHYAMERKGTNLIIINNTSIQTFPPSDWSTVTRWIYGGHASPTDFTSTEIALLIADGYSIDVGAGV